MTAWPSTTWRPTTWRPTSWKPTFAFTTAVAVIAAALTFGIALRRPDLGLVAVPFVVATLLALTDIPPRPRVAALRLSATDLLEGESTAVTVPIEADDTIDAIRVRIGMRGFLDPRPGRADVVTTPASGRADVTLRLTATRWGRSEVGPVAVTALAAGGLLRVATTTGAVRLATVPLREGFEATTVVPRASGLTGLHQSRLRGEGTEVSGVREFRPGDRLRRINWRVSARSDALSVTETYSDLDAELCLVLDSAVDLGQSNAIGARSVSTLDVSVRAAASIAAYYLRHGDRVGVVDLARPASRVAARAGRLQLNVISSFLIDVTAGDEGRARLDHVVGSISGRALVIVLSPLIGSVVASQAVGLARAGGSVLVVDTLSREVQPPAGDPLTMLAWRLLQLQRADTADALRVQGVPVVTWQGSGSLDLVLRELSRAARAPRVRA